MNVPNRVNAIATENFAALLGAELVSQERDRVVVRLPWRPDLGVGRIHGGAISALIDIAATAAFWSSPDVTPDSRGATVGFTVNFLNLAVETELVATASVRRRGGTLCTGDVSVTNAHGQEVAMAVVTYKLTGYRKRGAGGLAAGAAGDAGVAPADHRPRAGASPAEGSP